MPQSGYVSLPCKRIMAETEKALLVLTEQGNLNIWIPKTQIADVDDYEQGDTDVTLSITEWIAKEKDLSSEVEEDLD